MCRRILSVANRLRKPFGVGVVGVCDIYITLASSWSRWWLNDDVSLDWTKCRPRIWKLIIHPSPGSSSAHFAVPSTHRPQQYNNNTRLTVLSIANWVSQCASARQSAPDIQDSILKSACLPLSDHMVEWNYWKWVVLVLHNPHASPSFVQSFFMFRSPISFGGWIDHRQQAESNREIITSNCSAENEKEGSELSRRENWNEICNRIVYYYQLKTIKLEMKKFHCTQQQPQHLGDS